MKLSEPQIAALLAGLETKLHRSSMGWGYEDAKRGWCVYSPATVEALCRRGLMDTNVKDGRVIDGAFHAHSPEVPKLQVWTNGKGREALEAEGMLGLWAWGRA